MLAGDVLMKLNGKPVDGMYSIRAAMVGVRPGETVPVEVKRRDQVVEGKLHGPQAQSDEIPQKRGHDELHGQPDEPEAGRSAGHSVGHDVVPERAGRPVIDVNGKFVGLALSRAGRTETYILLLDMPGTGGRSPQVQQYQAGCGVIPDARLWTTPMTHGAWRKPPQGGGQDEPPGTGAEGLLSSVGFREVKR
ncbi:MAG: hypothetical protein ACLT8E_06265 [Akkermansia sp.]